MNQLVRAVLAALIGLLLGFVTTPAASAASYRPSASSTYDAPGADVGLSYTATDNDHPSDTSNA